MEEAPVSADAPRFAPLGAREERTADWLHKRSPRASALLIGVVMALLPAEVRVLGAPGRPRARAPDGLASADVDISV